MTMTEKQFEEYLTLYDSAIPPASRWLSERIISAAARRTSGGMAAWLEELLAVVLPQPAFALATVLTLGIVIGFALPAGSGDNTQPSYFEDSAL